MTRIFAALCLCFSCLFLHAQSVGDYQSAASGNWNVLATWQTWNGASWVVPASTPTSASGIITIQAGHTVTITAAVTIDDVVVNGTLNSSGAVIVTINNGTSADLQINGTYGDLSTGSVAWPIGATWQMGPTGTLLRTTGSSSNNWQSNYQGGIATIPATSNWIIRKVNAQQPSLSTTTPASGSVYPNLFIENNQAANWVTPAGSSFTGAATFATIKGNLDIGGAGTGTVDFLNSNTFTSPLLVMGNVIIRTGDNYRNYGTGIEIQGNLTVNGSVTYDANDARKLVFSGAINQTVSGPGTLNVYDCILNKTAGTVTLNRSMTIDNLMTFSSGIINTTLTNLLIFSSTGTVTSANNSSFANGPVRYFGTAAFTFPVGKGSDYQPIAIGAYAATAGGFWFEDFNNGCTSLCDAALYTGPNGAWTVTQPSANGASANKFWISCAENGNAVGACGTGCGNNATLHIGNVSTSPAAFLFCPSGDCGAAYDAGLGNGAVLTDKRAESPTINCTGKFGITASFKYMENGQGSSDNATFWYYDGTSWAQIADMGKTATTCAGGQGLWTAYSVVLPASADNNPNVKVGFHWVNNDDGAGNDPPFAVDDVKIGTAPESFTAEYFYANPQVVYNNNLAPTLSSIFACEYWVLDRAPLTSTAATTVQLTWDGNSCPVIPLISDTRVAHFDLTTWQDEGNGGNTGTVAAGTVISAAPVTYFSPFTVGLIPPTPLPIEMTQFGGECVNGKIKLTWTTATEQNNDFFTIERSVDGLTFSQLGLIHGAGNSDHTLHYSLEDTDPVSGTDYYRIKQTDFNGAFSYSRIIAVNAADCDNNNLLVTNIISGSSDLEIDYLHGKAPVTIEIYSADGRLVKQVKQLPTESNYHLETSSWSSSIYFIRITDGISSITKKFQK